MPKLSPARANAIHRDMRVFHRAMDWAAWWEEWSTSIEPTGRYTYPTLPAFLRTKKLNPTQLQFCYWYLGAQKEELSPFSSWCKTGPHEWAEKRKTGGWFTDTYLKKVGSEVRRRVHALEALREAGNGITLNSMVRAEQLAQELDRSFKGTMFLEKLSFAENMKRATDYVALHSQVLGLLEKAQELYAKSHGVNFEDMSGLVQLMQASAMAGAIAGDNAGQREKQALAAVVDMMLVKSKKYGMELPPGTIDVVAEAVEVHSKKKNVQ